MRILSGVQPSGKLHVGNYFGAIRQFIELQDEGEGFYFIADHHALTTVRDGATMRGLVRDVALDFLALGLDPKKAVIFRQSDIPEIPELMWLLSSIAPMGLLQRAHSYKDKVARGIAADVGLFTYPILMAADILLYESDVVPVGKDQKQHLEITQELAAKFNHTFCAGYDTQTYEGGVLKRPAAKIMESTAVVPGTDGQKMSKSYANTIDLFGTDKQLKKQVMGIVTDSLGLEDPKDPDNCNVFALYKLFATGEEQSELAERYRAGGFGYGHAKLALLDKIHETFDGSRARRQELEDDIAGIEAILTAGAERAREVGSRVLSACKRATGLAPEQ